VGYPWNVRELIAQRHEETVALLEPPAGVRHCGRALTIDRTSPESEASGSSSR
jgi:hypothetical protein